MRWIRRLRISTYLRSALWVVPVASVILAVALVQRDFADAEDRQSARAADPQGLGHIE